MNCAVEVEPHAAAVRVLCQSVWLELGTQEVPREGGFLDDSDNSERDH